MREVCVTLEQVLRILGTLHAVFREDSNPGKVDESPHNFHLFLQCGRIGGGEGIKLALGKPGSQSLPL